MQVFETTAILEFDSKSAPSVAYSIHIVESMGSGYPFLRGAARNSNPETYPNSAQVLRIAAKLLIQGVPGTPSPRWWLQKAIVKSIKSAPSAAYSDQILGSRGAGYPSPKGLLEKPALKPTPNRHQVLHIAVKSLVERRPLPSPSTGGGWVRGGEFPPEGPKRLI